jgi:ABC-2 type transport system ATP-binding protein
MNESAPAIRTRGLTKEYRLARRRERLLALDRLDFEVGRGQVVALLGPNGSGKSTTLKLLLGLIRPGAGTAEVLSKPAGDRETLRRVGYLPEETRLFDFLTARETLVFFAAVAGVVRRERAGAADALLEEVGLAASARRRTAGFSKGMARRLGLAAALIGRPDLFILDEPTSGLDPLGAAEVKAKIRELKAEGKTVLLSSHLLSDVEDVCDRIAILGRGRLVREGPADELLALRDEWVVRFRGGEPGFAEKVLGFVKAGGAEPVEVRPAREDLESLFLRLFGGA